MSDDDDLFSYTKARVARDEGMERVEANAAPGWGETMYDLVIEIAREFPHFTADDVFALAHERGIYNGTHDRRAFGPVMLRAARNLICRKAHMPGVMCQRTSRHGAPLSVWSSMIVGTAWPSG